MSPMIPFALLCVVGALAFVISSTPNPLRTSKAYHLVHFLVTFYLIFMFWEAFWAGAASAGPGVLIDFFCHVAMLLMALLLQARLVYFVVSHYVTDLFPAWVMGDDRLRMPKTYDRAEKAERAREFAQAAQLYREAIAQDPKDLEARRRLAEVHVQLGDYDAAIRELTAALAETAELDLRGPLVVRLAEILVQHRNDRMAALERLYKFKDEAAGTRHAEYVQARIEALTK
ncbi:MAG: tetratricopeptide repeat protein [Planctomycetes bacterium]|nr:tetratricopeptide repeat protein [Planctomycetota bacterium]